MITFLPEWTPLDCVMLALPHDKTDWNYILDEAKEQYHRLVKALTDNEVNVMLLCRDAGEAEMLMPDCRSEFLHFIEADFNDTWTRDYGPLSVMKDGRLRALDFGFNGWGLKFASDKDNLVNLNLQIKNIFATSSYRNERDFILEGGSVETDGEGTLLTTSRCLCSPNRNGGKTKAELVEILTRRLGVSHILFLDYGALDGDDTDSHVDTLARIAPGSTILFTGCRNQEDPQFEELLRMKAQLTMFRNQTGEPFNLIELPLPDAIYDETGERLPATYANYLVTEKTIFMPTYGQILNDDLAMQTIRIAFPEHNIVGIDCRTLIKQHGSLHCATMQIPSGLINF